jgi:hypothetical protein
MRITFTNLATRRTLQDRHRSILRFALGSFLVCGLVAAQPFQISRWTVDGGGAVRSQGGDFDLSGTIGQPDAGVLSGGSFELTGGFWFAIPLADCNEDGLVGLSDNAGLVACLTGPTTPAGSGCLCFDTDGSGTVDLADYATMQAGFHGD